jgi:hypothetical protein
MMTINDRYHHPRATLAALILSHVALVACDKMPLLAPTASTVTVTSPVTTISLGGTAEISAFVAESSGTPVQNGTVVRFTTNLGRMNPVEVQTRNGLAVSMFEAGDVSGLADIRATSGAAGGATGGSATASASNAVQISVGAAAVDSVQLIGSPLFVPFRGGTVQLTATVLGTNGRAIPGIPVRFNATQGTLSQQQVTSDGNGEARTSLTTDRDASVTAAAGTKTSSAITITRRPAPAAPTVTLAGTGATATVGIGQLWTFTATVAGTDDETRPVKFEWNFGDDTEATSNGNIITHVYTSPNVRRTVTVKVVLSNDSSITAQAEIIIANF